MARQATKACGNRYYEARMRAAMYNEKFLTRAGAVESLPGVTEDSLKKYELDINRPPNIVVALMADGKCLEGCASKTAYCMQQRTTTQHSTSTSRRRETTGTELRTISAMS